MTTTFFWKWSKNFILISEKQYLTLWLRDGTLFHNFFKYDESNSGPELCHFKSLTKNLQQRHSFCCSFEVSCVLPERNFYYSVRGFIFSKYRFPEIGKLFSKKLKVPRPRIERGTFRSSVWRSPNWAIEACLLNFLECVFTRPCGNKTTF